MDVLNRHFCDRQPHWRSQSYSVAMCFTFNITHDIEDKHVIEIVPITVFLSYGVIDDIKVIPHLRFSYSRRTRCLNRLAVRVRSSSFMSRQSIRFQYRHRDLPGLRWHRQGYRRHRRSMVMLKALRGAGFQKDYRSTEGQSRKQCAPPDREPGAAYKPVPLRSKKLTV